MPDTVRQRFIPRLGVVAAAVLVLAADGVAAGTTELQRPSELIGVWRGTSTCTDRVAAPACQDEIIVYEFTAGAQPGTVHWVADKVMNGKRESMGEFDLEYDTTEKCWTVEFASPRVKVVWRLSADGRRLSGTARLLPGNETVRKVDARKQ